jgi:two-component system, NtrC family, response regulator AtoC
VQERNDQTTSSYVVFDESLAAPNAWYVVVSVGNASSRVVPLPDGGELVFGRQQNCEVVIDHDGVSRRHARVQRRRNEITVEDLESRNGTLVNGAQIAGARRLAAGDVLSIGPASVVIAAASPTRTARQVAPIGELEDRLEVEVDRAIRYRRPLGLVMLRLEGPTERVVAHVDALLGQLRRMDLLAEYGNDELAMLLPEANPAAVASVAQRAIAVGPELTATAGTATLPEDGAHAGELISIARDRLRGARAPKRKRTEKHHDLGDVVAVDPLMKQVFQLAGRAAASPITVLIVGETGVGKEVVADAIHRLGPRAKGPLVRLNCASLPEALVESELFGHEKGAFTGAVASKQGFFEAATGGTLFLDEVGELPPATQAKLLRALEQRRILRVGGTKEIAVDARLVCATNRDLEEEVARGRFRQDLFFRISAFVIPVPPLRDRRMEIVPLATRFVRELSADFGDAVATISPAALEALRTYDWPGNVRELRNVIERALVLSGGEPIEPHHLPDRICEDLAPTPTPRLGRAFSVRQRVAEVERDAVVSALDSTGGNQSQAARKLGISRFALIRLMVKHDLKPRPR